jgi:predicted metal-binding membrane protein
MSTQGIILIDIIGLGLILLTLNLVRTHKLYVGYAVMWALAVAGAMVPISIPPLMSFITVSVGATFPASAVTLLAFVFIFIVLIFLTVELSTISSRQVELAQSLALNELMRKEQHPSINSETDRESSTIPAGQ